MASQEPIYTPLEYIIFKNRESKFNWTCSLCGKFKGSRTLHSFRKHQLCCVRGEAAGDDESDFGDDGDVDSCHHKEGNPCSCVYDDSKPAKWSTYTWKNTYNCRISCRVKHDSIIDGYQAVPSASRVMKLKQNQRERRGNEQQGRAFHQDQTDLQNQIRDLQQQLDAKERDYTLANGMVEELQQEVGDAKTQLNDAKSNVADLMDLIEADCPPNFNDQTLLEQLQLFKAELEEVIVPDNDDMENEGSAPRSTQIIFPSRLKKVSTN